MDCLVGFAVAAVTAPIPYCKPKIVDKVGTIKLVEARHPCLELLDNINFIPNSIDFDEVNYCKIFSISPPTKKQGLCWALDVICVKFTARYFYFFYLNFGALRPRYFRSGMLFQTYFTVAYAAVEYFFPLIIFAMKFKLSILCVPRTGK